MEFNKMTQAKPSLEPAIVYSASVVVDDKLYEEVLHQGEVCYAFLDNGFPKFVKELVLTNKTIYRPVVGEEIEKTHENRSLLNRFLGLFKTR